MSFIECAELPDHVELECNSWRKGGFSAVGIPKLNHGITDWTSAAQWQAAIDAGNVRIVKRIKASLPEPAEVKSDNPVGCGAQQILDGFDWTAEWMDANVNTFNDDFYKTTNVVTRNLVLFNCDNDEIRVIEQDVTFVAKPMYPGSNRENQTYKVVANWSTKPDWFPVLYTAPAGIFN